MNLIHLGDDAALYALGTLDANAKTRVERHAAHCARCMRDLGIAESSVAALDCMIAHHVPPEGLARRIAASASVPPVRSRRPLRTVLARAAVFALGLAVGSAGWSTYKGHFAGDSSVGQVSFTPAVVNAPKARVVYARNDSWIYVEVAGHYPDCHVAAVLPHGARDLGVPVRDGSRATLFTRRPVGVKTIRLLRGATVVSTASLAP